MAALGYLAPAMMLLGAAAFALGHRGPGLALLGISLVMQGVRVLARGQRQGAMGFLGWLRESREDLRQGPVVYRGRPVELATPLVRYKAAASFLVMTVRIPSRYFIVGLDHPRLWRLGLSLFTALLGWWAVPFGPFHAAEALIWNLRGGERQTVGELLQRMEKLEAREPAST